MKQGWEIIPFEDSIVKVKYTTKIPSNDYLEQGLYPIVSQEEGLISGYWNEENDVFKISTPVVIFGDHTRILKYVDFDFVLGADGVKILQPIKSIDAKFFKLYLESCKIPSLGYSRHYKLLKELQVPVPPREEQERIVAELDCLSGVIERKREQLRELDALAQSIFYQMFGDPISNEKGWAVKKLKNITSKIGSGATPKGGNESYKDEGISLIRSLNVHNNLFVYKDLAHIDDEQADALKNVVVEDGDVLLNITGASVARCCVVPNDVLPARVNQHVAIIRPKELGNNIFICYQFTSNAYQQELLSIGKSNGATREALTKGQLEELDIIMPPLALQQEFADKIEAIEKQKELIKKSISETETLFNVRMDYYFN